MTKEAAITNNVSRPSGQGRFILTVESAKGHRISSLVNIKASSAGRLGKFPAALLHPHRSASTGGNFQAVSVEMFSSTGGTLCPVTQDT